MTEGRVPRLDVLPLALGAAGSALAQRVTDAQLPSLSVEFGRPLTDVSWVITAFTLGYSAFQLFAGPLGDRLGKLRVIHGATLACCAASLFCAFAPTLAVLIVARVLAGAATAAIMPLSLAWLGDIVPYQDRQPTLAWLVFGWVSGLGVGQLLGGVAADLLGRHMPFLVVAAIYLSAAILTARLRTRYPAIDGAQARGGHSPRSGLLRELGSVLRDRPAQLILGTVFLEGVFVFGAYAYFATFLHGRLHISLTLAGMLNVGFAVGGIAFASAARLLVRRLGESGLSGTGGMLMALAMVLVSVASRPATAALGTILLGLGYYMLHNTLQTNATQMAPERRGAAVSVFALSAVLGQSLGVAIGAWILEGVGARPLFLACGVGLALVGAFYVLRISRHGHGRRVS